MEEYAQNIEKQRRLFLKEKQVQESELAKNVAGYIKKRKRSPLVHMLLNLTKKK